MARWLRLIPIGLAALLLLSAATLVSDTDSQAVPLSGPDGIIETFAGGGVGDGWLATDATFIAPQDVVRDDDGNLYVSDESHCTVRKVDTATGIIDTFAGIGLCGSSPDGGLAVESSLNVPFGLALDDDGNLYVVERSGCRVRMVDTDGTITTVAGTGTCGVDPDGLPATESALSSLRGVAWAADTLYITMGCRIRAIDSSGIITTVAGTGTCGYDGNGGPATSAQLNGPWDVAAVGDGDIYIADTGNNRVRRVSAGIIETVAGDGTFGAPGAAPVAATSASINPRSIDISEDGVLYGSQSCTLWRVKDGVLSRFVSNCSQFSTHPDHRGVAAAPLDSVVYARRQGCTVSLYVVGGGGNTGPLAGNGKCNHTPDGTSALEAALDLPVGVVATPDGDVYVLLEGNRGTKRISDGIVTSVTYPFEPQAPPWIGAIASDPYGNVYTVSFGQDCELYRIVGDTAVVHATDICSAMQGNSGHQHNLALVADAYGNFYFAEAFHCSVYKIDALGNVSLYAGRNSGSPIHCPHGSDGPAAGNDLGRPTSLAVDPNSGHLYVGIEAGLSDPARVRRISSTGMMSTVAGAYGGSGDGGSATSAWVGVWPLGLILDEYDDLYIAHYGEGGCRIRRVTGGIINTIVGGDTCGFSGDGGPAVDATIRSPWDIGLDGNGTLYVADRDRHRVRVVYGVSRDSDDDGFSDAHEERLGKDPHSYCNVMRADVNGDGAVNILDFATMAPYFGKTVPPGPPRYRQGPPPFGTQINIQDFSKLGMVYAQTIAVCD